MYDACLKWVAYVRFQPYTKKFCVYFFPKNENLIRWKGYSSLNDTWEVEENLNETTLRYLIFKHVSTQSLI